MSFSVGSHDYQGSSMIGVCDAELLGTTVTQDGVRLAVTREYYGGRTVGEAEASRLFSAAAIINIAGARAVDLAVREGVGPRGGVKTVKGVPFMIVFRA